MLILVAAIVIVLAVVLLLQFQTPPQTPTPTPTPPPTPPPQTPAPTPAPPPAPPAYKFIIYTGGTGGTYYPVGTRLGELVNKYASPMSADVRTSGASVANANALAAGDGNIAFIQNDIAYYAYHGLYMFEGRKIGLAGVVSLYPETIQIVVLADSPIKSVYDLAGRKVAVGATGSGTAVNAEQILKAAGVWDRVEKVYAAFTEAAQMLKLRQVDAAFIVAGYPTSAVVELATTTPVRLVEVPDDVYQKLRQEGYLFFVRQTVPKGTYNGLDSDVKTLAVMAIIVVRSDVPEDAVYHLLKTLDTNLAEFRNAHARVSNFAIEKALEGMSIPLHPGAVRFYREKGISIPSELLPR
ncbi:MAG: TAXI family TRAP transporter solute-binding subunit, partial [Pyrobaculum sp.]